MKPLNWLFLSTALVVAGCSDDDDDDNVNDTGTGSAVEFGAAPDGAVLLPSAVIEVITEDNARFHVIEFAAEIGGYTATLLETDNSLVMVDTGSGDEANWGPELRAYIDAIDKDASIIITHDHADHFGAIGSFSDLPLHAETAVASALAADTQFVAAYPGTIHSASGTVRIGDLDYHFGVVSQAETGENGYVAVPAVNAFFAGDLVYIEAHPYLREYTPLEAPDELDNWIAGLERIKADFGDFDYLFVGHGGVSNEVQASIDSNLEYLALARDLILQSTDLSSGNVAMTNQDVVDELALQYPDWISGGLTLSLPGAFGEGDPGASWF